MDVEEKKPRSGEDEVEDPIAIRSKFIPFHRVTRMRRASNRCRSKRKISPCNVDTFREGYIRQEREVKPEDDSQQDGEEVSRGLLQSYLNLGDQTTRELIPKEPPESTSRRCWSI